MFSPSGRRGALRTGHSVIVFEPDKCDACAQNSAQGTRVISCSLIEGADMLMLRLVCGLLFVTPELALTQEPAGATIRIDGVVSGTWSGRAL